jgi:hypothetical protein
MVEADTGNHKEGTKEVQENGEGRFVGRKKEFEPSRFLFLQHI